MNQFLHDTAEFVSEMAKDADDQRERDAQECQRLLGYENGSLVENVRRYVAWSENEQRVLREGAKKVETYCQGLQEALVNAENVLRDLLRTEVKHELRNRVWGAATRATKALYQAPKTPENHSNSKAV